MTLSIFKIITTIIIFGILMIIPYKLSENDGWLLKTFPTIIVILVIIIITIIIIIMLIIMISDKLPESDGWLALEPLVLDHRCRSELYHRHNFLVIIITDDGQNSFLSSSLSLPSSSHSVFSSLLLVKTSTLPSSTSSLLLITSS